MGREGERRAATLLDALGWTPRPDRPDNGCDFSIEIPATADTPAERVFVQVKGSNGFPRLTGDVWSVPVRERALRRYRKLRHPVFLLAVDLATDGIRWLDLQGLLLASPESEDAPLPSESKTRRFHLKPTQVVSAGDAQDLAQAIRQAIDRQSDRHHPPGVALAKHSARMEALDPRIKVVGEYIHDVERYTLLPRETIHFKLTVSDDNPEDRRSLAEALKYGQRAQIDAKAVRIEGSKLLKQIGIDAVRLTIEPEKRPCRIRLSVPFEVDSSSEDAPYLDIDGFICNGWVGGDVELGMADLPISVLLRLSSIGEDPTITWGFDTRSWIGKPVARLPYLRPLLRLIDRLCDRGKLAFAVHEYGEVRHLSTMTVTEPIGQFIGNMRIFLHAVSDLAALCAWLGSDFAWRPEPLDLDELAPFWHVGVRVIQRQPATLPVTGMSVSASPQSEQLFMEDPALARCHLTYDTTLKVNAWDEEIGEIPIKLDFAGAHLERSAEPEGGFIVRPPKHTGVSALLLEVRSSLEARSGSEDP